MIEAAGESSTTDAVYTPLPEGFAELPAGPVLGDLLRGVDRAALNGYQLVELIQARYRQLSHDQSELLRDLAELTHVPHKGWAPRHRSMAGKPLDPPARAPGVDLDVTDEVAFALTLTTGSAEDLIALSYGVHTFPQVLTALADGRLDLAKAKVLIEETDLCQPDERNRIIDTVLDGAEFRTTGSLKAQLRKLLFKADPDMVHKRYQKAIRERTVQLRSHRDGTASLHGWALPPDQAAAAMDYLSRLARATKQAGDPDTRFDDRDQRTLGQLRADIMVNLLTGVDPTRPTSQGGAGAVEPAGRKGVINLTVPLTTVLQLNQHPGDLAGFGPVVAEIAAAAMAELTKSSNPVWRFTLTHDGRVVHEGRLHYRPTADQVAYVRARDRRCQAPNCRRAADQCDIDHVTGWEHGGVTNEDQLCLLCRRHHRIKDQGFSLYRNDFGLVWISPHGHAHPVSLGRELSTEQRRLLQHLVNTDEFATTVAGHQRE